MVNCGSITETRPAGGWEGGAATSELTANKVFVSRRQRSAGILPQNINQAASITENVVMFRSARARCIM